MNTSNFTKVWKNAYYKRSFINYIVKCVDYTYKSLNADINSIVTKAINDNLNDESIAILIHRKLHKLPKKNIHHTNIRVMERVNTIHQFINTTVTSYLDYGCGDGTITEKIGHSLGIKRDKLYGVDIKTHCPANITYINTKVNLESNSVDLVTALVSLHHIIDLSSVLATIYRILRPGGVFIIREHDFDGTDDLLSYLNAIHIFNNMYDEPYHLPGYTLYKEKNAWDNEIISAGFSPAEYKTYTGNNPQRLYYRSYIKII